MPKTHALPRMCMQKRTGADALAYVKLNGVRRYCGLWDTNEAQQAYERLIGEWLQRGRAPELPPAHLCTVNEAVEAYLVYCESYYATSPKQTLDTVILALRNLCGLYGRMPISELTGLHIKALRETLINRRGKGDPDRPTLNVTTINRRIEIIKRMVKYAVSIDLCPAEVLVKVNAVENLVPGRCAAPSPRKVMPVPVEDIEATKEHLNRTVCALVDLQLACGARPGELVNLRRCDILQVSDDLWEVPLEQHKMAHRGRRRVLLFGPASIAILKPVILRTKPEGHLFPASDGMLPRIEAAHGHRRPNQKPNKKKGDRVVGPCYTAATYRRAIHRVCDEHDILKWSPNQLRHNYGTEVRRRANLEAARLLLGHGEQKTSEIYAEQDLTAARELARKLS